MIEGRVTSQAKYVLLSAEVLRSVGAPLPPNFCADQESARSGTEVT